MRVRCDSIKPYSGGVDLSEHVKGLKGPPPGVHLFRIAGMLHPWPGQIRLKRNVFKTLFTSSGTDELRDVAPLSEATADLS